MRRGCPNVIPVDANQTRRHKRAAVPHQDESYQSRKAALTHGVQEHDTFATCEQRFPTNAKQLLPAENYEMLSSCALDDAESRAVAIQMIFEIVQDYDPWATSDCDRREYHSRLSNSKTLEVTSGIKERQACVVIPIRFLVRCAGAHRYSQLFPREVRS